jgi:hypothetical protein
MTVWIYIDTAKEVGDVDQPEGLQQRGCWAERWFAEYDPEGVAFEYPISG